MSAAAPRSRGPAGLPPLGEVLAGVRVVRIPLRVPFRGVTEREVALLPGPLGWGEFGPFLEYGPRESSRWLASAIEAAYAGWPPPVRDRIPVNATVPAVPATDVAGVLARFPGCTTAKVKVAEPGQGLPEDLDRVAAVRDVLGETGRIRVDANGGWDVQEATRALGALAAYQLEYAEQPCPDVPDLIRLRTALARNGINVPIAADESIRKAADPLRVAREGAADLVVVKVAPSVAYAARSRSSPSAGFRRWSPPPWTRPWGWRPGWLWQPRCRSCRGPAGWGRWRCSPATSSSRRSRRCPANSVCHARRLWWPKNWLTGGTPDPRGRRGGAIG